MDLDGKLAQEAAKDLEEWFVSHGQAKPHEIEAIGVGCNVANEDEVKAAMAKIIEKFGRIDVLVCVVAPFWLLVFESLRVSMVGQNGCRHSVRVLFIQCV